MSDTLKTRLLRRYEAGANVCSTDAGDPELGFYSPFGPLIAKAEVPAALVDRLNAFADTIVTDGKGMEFVVPQHAAFGDEHSLAAQTEKLIVRYLQHVDGMRVDDVEFQAFWIVSQYQSTPSPVHFHSGDLSGVLYLKVPEIANASAEEKKTYISGRQAGYINFIDGGRQQFSRSIISFKPKVGDFYIFPGWLLHGAEPFRGTGERRSLAFNAFVRGGF
jgi:Putative 2OG-Fe(II) oxygenase